MDAINSKTEEVLNKMCDNMGLSEDTKRKTIEENYDWFIGYNDTELDFVISDNPAQMIWRHFNDICIPLSKRLSVVIRVKDEEAPILSGDKAKGNIINMSIKGVIAYNTMQISMAQLYLFGSEKAISFMQNINILYNMKGRTE